ncbi:MAG: tetratricopeptide repeat protein [Spirochaetaceae bacterium]|jgi:tetratricopeptide (TPR) repeat protein|nr:tetratricopeptide repeat protein [Spirochaetaceae bacterium]
MILYKRLIAAPVIILCVICSCKTVQPGKPHPSKPNDFMERLAAKLEKNDLTGALALFDTLTPEESVLAQNKLAKASVYLSMGQSGPARAEANEVIAADKTNAEAQYVLSVVEASEKKFRQQRTILEEIVKSHPNFVPALNDLGRIAIEMQKNLKNAASYYDNALKAEPANEESLLGRARVYRLEKKPDLALNMLNKAAQSHPKSALVYNERGKFYRNQGALDDALADMNTAVKLAPNDYWFSYDRGLILIDKNLKKEALDEFKRAQRINPDIFISYVYTAGISDELGFDDEAEKSYKKIVAIKPDYYFGFEGIAVHSLKKGNYAAAADNFIQAWGYAQEEYNYALLAAYCLLKKTDNSKEHKDRVRKVVNDAIKQVKRDSLDYYVIRLFNEGVGDVDVAHRAERETDGLSKIRAYFYLSCFYEVHNQPGLAEHFEKEFRKFDRRDLIEYRINDILHPDNKVVVNEPVPNYP